MTFIVSKRGVEVWLYLTLVHGQPHWSNTKETAIRFTRWSQLNPIIKRSLRQDKKNYRIIIQMGK